MLKAKSRSTVPLRGPRKRLSHHSHLLHLPDELDVDPVVDFADAGHVRTFPGYHLKGVDSQKRAQQSKLYRTGQKIDESAKMWLFEAVVVAAHVECRCSL